VDGLGGNPLDGTMRISSNGKGWAVVVSGGGKHKKPVYIAGQFHFSLQAPQVWKEGFMHALFRTRKDARAAASIVRASMEWWPAKVTAVRAEYQLTAWYY